MTKATQTHTEYVILTAFPRHQWLLSAMLHDTCTGHLVIVMCVPVSGAAKTAVIKQLKYSWI